GYTNYADELRCSSPPIETTHRLLRVLGALGVLAFHFSGSCHYRRRFATTWSASSAVWIVCEFIWNTRCVLISSTSSVTASVVLSSRLPGRIVPMPSRP